MSAYELYTPLAGGFGPLALLGRIISCEADMVGTPDAQTDPHTGTTVCTAGGQSAVTTAAPTIIITMKRLIHRLKAVAFLVPAVSDLPADTAA